MLLLCFPLEQNWVGFSYFKLFSVVKESTLPLHRGLLEPCHSWIRSALTELFTRSRQERACQPLLKSYLDVVRGWHGLGGQPAWMDTGSALIARLFITSEVLNCWLYPRKHTNTTSQRFLTLERACVQPWWYRTLPKMLGGQESPDLAWLYHRVVPLHSYPALRPRRSNPSSHTGHVRSLGILHINSSLLHPERCSTSPASPLPTLPWQQMPALLFLCPSAASNSPPSNTYPQDTLTPPRKSQCPHPAPQHPSKSRPRPHRGSSPASPRVASPQKGRQRSKDAQSGGVSHICHVTHPTGGTLVPRNEVPKRTHFHSHKENCSVLAFCSLQILHWKYPTLASSS